MEKAESYLREARAMEERLAPAGLDLAETFSLLGDIARQRREMKLAEDYCRRSLKITEKLVPGSGRHAESLAALALIFRSQGRLAVASSLFGQALDMFELQAARLGGAEEIRAGFRAHFTEHYRAYIDVLMKQHKPELAFQVFERSQARSLLEILAEAHVDLRNGADPKLLMREHSLQQMLAAQSARRMRSVDQRASPQQQENLDKKTRALVAEFQQVESDIRTGSPAYAALTQPGPMGVEDVQRELLDPETILLEYSLGDQRSYLWAVTQRSLAAYTLPGKSVIESAARKLYKQLSAPGQIAGHETPAESGIRAQKALTEFSQMVLGPVVRQMGAKRLLIVADAALEYIPFGILPAPESWGSQTSTVPLIVKHELLALPSASVLAVLRREAVGRTQPEKSVAVLADPVFNRDDPRVRMGAMVHGAMSASQPPASKTFPLTSERLTRSAKDGGLSYLPRLPFSRREAEAISAATPGTTTLTALDFAASRATALSPELAQYRVLHFATHGIVNNRHPELSGLALSLVDEGGNPQNGFLGLPDIYNLSLPIELVVLSACETGLGKEIRGEGLMGLTRGFMYAGASRVMASMWTVNDAATAELMASFYQGMERRGLRPAAALRQAQISIWKQKRWSDPYFWGAFQVQGDWK
jgi:CHAT domain-containing protein